MKFIVGLAAVFAAVVVLGVQRPAHALDDLRLILCIDGIDGGATLIGKVGCIDLLTVEHSLVRPKGDKVKEGDIEFTDVRVLKGLDTSTADLLMQALAANTPIDRAEIFVTATIPVVVDLMILAMVDASIGDISFSLSDGGDPVETIDFRSERFEWKVFDVADDGTIIGDETFCFDTSMGSECVPTF